MKYCGYFVFALKLTPEQPRKGDMWGQEEANKSKGMWLNEMAVALDA